MHFCAARNVRHNSVSKLCSMHIALAEGRGQTGCDFGSMLCSPDRLRGCEPYLIKTRGLLRVLGCAPAAVPPQRSPAARWDQWPARPGMSRICLSLRANSTTSFPHTAVSH